MSTSNLGALQLEALHMRHIVAQAAIGDLTGDRSGCIRCSACDRGNRIAVQHCAVSSCDATKGTAYETGTTTEAHSLATFHDGITNVAVGTESGCETSCKTICCSTGSGCHGTTTCTAEYIACRSGATAYTGNDPGGHHQFHAHAGTSLGHIQAHRSQVAIKTLCTLEVSKGTEHPQEDATLTSTQCTTVGDKLAHR